MRIDVPSLVALQSASRPQSSLPVAQPTDKPLFEPLNFPKAGTDLGPSERPETVPQRGPEGPGSKLDIKV
jgi:hypothetical protein